MHRVLKTNDVAPHILCLDSGSTRDSPGVSYPLLYLAESLSFGSRRWSSPSVRGVLATNDVAAVRYVTCRSAITYPALLLICFLSLIDHNPSGSGVAITFVQFQLIDLAVSTRCSCYGRRRCGQLLTCLCHLPIGCPSCDSPESEKQFSCNPFRSVPVDRPCRLCARF